MQNEVLEFYKFQSKIYDLTRWSFLFGREKLIREIHNIKKEANILEIGCGTGKNISELLNLNSNYNVNGLDLSADMIDVAKKKFEGNSNVQLLNDDFFQMDSLIKYDVIIFSYMLSMVGDLKEDFFIKAKSLLSTDGIIAVVDYHQSKLDWYLEFMLSKNVELNSNTLDLLNQYFTPLQMKISKAYLGIWTYQMFIGH
jgi:S-adenosylmethionine-diacylgycerolhomoserine-N-methlytransferase